MAQVCAGHTDGLAIRQHAHVVPHDLRVPERGPAVAAALGLEVRPGAAAGRDEQRPAGDRVVEGCLAGAVGLLEEAGGEPVAAVLQPGSTLDDLDSKRGIGAQRRGVLVLFLYA